MSIRIALAVERLLEHKAELMSEKWSPVVHEPLSMEVSFAGSGVVDLGLPMAGVP
jgi:hypothetical protein